MSKIKLLAGLLMLLPHGCGYRNPRHAMGGPAGKVRPNDTAAKAVEFEKLGMQAMTAVDSRPPAFRDAIRGLHSGVNTGQ